MDSPSQFDDQSRKPLIMVIDDNPEFLNGIELTLQMEDFVGFIAQIIMVILQQTSYISGNIGLVQIYIYRMVLFILPPIC